MQTLKLGASVLQARKDSFINPRKPIPSVFNIMIPGKPQMCPFQTGEPRHMLDKWNKARESPDEGVMGAGLS